MSHFSVIVITDSKPTKEGLGTILQPWHEYECTGVDDKYVIDVDVTDQVAEQFNKPERVVRLSDGQIMSRWDNSLYTKKPEKQDILSRNEFELPNGAEELDMTADEARAHGIGYATIAECAKEYFGAIERDGRFYDRTNPNKKWDWWQIGGRYTGKFVPNYDPETDKANQEVCWLCRGTGKRPDMVVANGCNGCSGSGIATKWKSLDDQMQLRDIPFTALRDVASRKAAKEWDTHHAIIDGRPLLTWDQAVEQCNKDWAAARELYWAQQPIKDLQANELCRWEGPDEFLVSRTQYIQTAADGCVSAYAIVKDGKWYERGSVGWFGIAVDEKDRSTWNAEFAKLTDSLPPETWFTVVDCHI